MLVRPFFYVFVQRSFTCNSLKILTLYTSILSFVMTLIRTVRMTCPTCYSGKANIIFPILNQPPGTRTCINQGAGTAHSLTASLTLVLRHSGSEPLCATAAMQKPFCSLVRLSQHELMSFCVRVNLLGSQRCLTEKMYMFMYWKNPTDWQQKVCDAQYGIVLLL